jgi:hypothetical protein
MALSAIAPFGNGESMKIPLFALLLAMAQVIAPAADGSSLSGKWKIQRSAAGNDSEQECTITQKNSDLTGTCATADRPPVQISGKVDGKNVTWTYKGDSPGGPVTVVYTGTVESSNKITGKVNAVEFAIEGEFSATRTN